MTAYFNNPGKENTAEALRIAKERATQLGIKKIIVSSTTGPTALAAMEALKGFQVIIVTHEAGFKEPNTSEFPEDIRRQVQEKGGTVITVTHAFGGLSMAMRKKFNTHVIGDIIANTLRIFGQGMKVACEILLMAADAGAVRTDEQVISMGGSNSGVDTAIVCRPVNAQRFFELRIQEILCKPHFM
ncbi:MAG: pyruvate kinase alpha/beta domain-containing protein [Chloroflexota bacterium]